MAFEDTYELQHRQMEKLGNKGIKAAVEIIREAGMARNLGV